MILARRIECKSCGHTAELVGDQPVCVFADCEKNQLEEDEIQVIQ